jgi:hypothetical protein
MESKDLEELYRRMVVATLHKAGTIIRGVELERIKMQAKPLLSMLEALEKSIEDVKPLESLGKLFKAKDDSETLIELFRFISQAGMVTSILEQLDKIVDSINRIREDLRKCGIIFEFPEVIKPQILEVAKKVTIPSMKGFLKGIIEV